MHADTFPMYHPKHDFCLADEDCRAEREALGWSVEAPKPQDDAPPEGDKGNQPADGETTNDGATDGTDEPPAAGDVSNASAGEEATQVPAAPVAPVATGAKANKTPARMKAP